MRFAKWAAVIGLFLGCRALYHYVAWVRTDGTLDVAKSEAIIKAVTDRRNDRQRRAVDPALNGYLVLEKVHDTQPAVISDLQAFEPFDSERDNFGPHGSCTAEVYASYPTRRAEIETLATRYEKALPALDEALSRPCFIVQGKDTPEASVFNCDRHEWWQWWRIALNQQAYGQLLEARGHLRRALDRHLANVTWGERLSRATWWHWGFDVTSMGLDGLLDLLSRHAGDLSDADCRAALARLKALSFEPGLFVAESDEAYLESLESVDRFVAQGPRKPLPEGPESQRRRRKGPQIHWAGLWWRIARQIGEYDRQKRVLGETYLASRPLVESLVPGYTQGSPISDVYAYLQERNVTAEHISFGWYWLAKNGVRRYRQIVTEMGALELILSLRLWRGAHGSFPTRLDALVPSYIASIPPDLLSADGHFIYESEGDDYALRSVPSALFPDPSFFTIEHLRFIWHAPRTVKH